MELEEYLTGYCRALDSARTVLVEGTARFPEADCSYGSCPYEANCPIAEGIRQLKEKAE